ncbi:hypothetical protein HUJ04_005909 [Dendroctonus ponderosae]|nr:hypothetical protein HUJ04_005909 [Dendroctonus ponderosae]
MTLWCAVVLVATLSSANAQLDLPEGLQDILNGDYVNLNLPVLLGQLNLNQICQQIKDNEIQREDICFYQLNVVCQDEAFRARMGDASSKFPYSGMLYRSRLDLGTFDECVELDVTREGIRVLGKHCVSGLVIPTKPLGSPDLLEGAHRLSTCLPDKCSAQYLLELANLSFVYPLFNDFSCSTSETGSEFTWDDYVVILFFALVVLVLLGATAYDWYAVGKRHVLVQAFSMLHNGRKLLQISRGSSDQVLVIHGLRVISMMWIVAGHSFVSKEDKVDNVEATLRFQFSRKSFYITTAYLAVDTFFFLSGFMLPYQYLKAKPQPLKEHVKRVPALILHRYVRLTPVAFVAFITFTSVFKHLGNGPLFHLALKQERDYCLDYWWSYFTYLQNYVNHQDVCLVHTWYISADWQMFLISPLILIPVALAVRRHFKAVMVGLGVVNVLVAAVPIALKFTFEDYDNAFETHSRLTGYFIGFGLGVFMRERSDQKLRCSKLTNAALWAVALLLLAAATAAYKELQLMIHSEQDQSYSTWVIVLRSGWCLGLCWVVYACHNGRGGAINWLLTTPLVQVLSKLTYCMYFTHLSFVLYFNATTRSLKLFSQFGEIWDAISVYMMTMVLSVFATMAFESPIIVLEKHLLSGRGLLQAKRTHGFNGPDITNVPQ